VVQRTNCEVAEPGDEVLQPLRVLFVPPPSPVSPPLPLPTSPPPEPVEPVGSPPTPTPTPPASPDLLPAWLSAEPRQQRSLGVRLLLLLLLLLLPVLLLVGAYATVRAAVSAQAGAHVHVLDTVLGGMQKAQRLRDEGLGPSEGGEPSAPRPGANIGSVKREETSTSH